MTPLPTAFPDPRPAPLDPPAAALPWYALAAALLASPGGAESDRLGRELEDALAHALLNTPSVVEHAIEAAPGPDIARQLWRSADRAFSEQRELASDAVCVTPFAIPLVVVAGRTTPGTAHVPGVLPDPPALAQLLAEGGALGGSKSLAVSPVLVGTDALAVGNLPAWRALRTIGSDAAADSLNPLFVPASIAVESGAERVHLRFVIGTALAGAGRNVFTGKGAGKWGRAFAAKLGSALATEGTTVLALPREPRGPLPARHQGLLAQREVSAQMFATNAIRKFRASVGEPVAVISAHRAADTPGRGELRLSLSSVFALRDAEGFRCPIHAVEPVTAPLRMLLDLLRDCRVSDVRLVAGVHPASTPGNAMPLFFRPDTIP